MATTSIAIATMSVAQVPKPGGDFEIVEREIPKPNRGQVRIKIQACGICHSDVLTKDGGLPGIQYPRIPGHEVAGMIDELGEGVSECRRRLAWRTRRNLSLVPPWRFSQLPESANTRFQLRRRLPAIHGGPSQRCGANTGES